MSDADLPFQLIGDTSEQHYVCKKCGMPSAKLVSRCPSCCGHWTIMQRPATHQRSVEERATEPVSSTVAVVTDEPRVSTGWPELDAVWGGGLRVGSVSLLWGEGGLGKTTLFMGIAHRTPVAQVLLIQSEQPQTMVMTTAARIGAMRTGFDILATDDLDTAVRAIGRKPYGLVIVDSLQGLTDTSIDSGPASVKQGKRVGKRLTKLAHDQQLTMLISNHATVSGGQAGGTFNVHGVDGRFELLGNRQDPSGLREIVSDKHRFGPGGLRARMRITRSGMEMLPPAPPAETSKPDGRNRSDESPPRRTRKTQRQ